MRPSFVLRALVLVASSVVLFVNSARADIGVTITSPQAGAVSGNDLALSVKVASLYSANVRASVGELSTQLRETQRGVYTGVLTLTGIEKGRQVARVEVTDPYGMTGKAEAKFVLDRAPELTVSPRDFANPKLELKVECTDDGPKGCVRIEVAPLGLTGTNLIDQTVSLKSYEGKSVELEIKATDDSGQTTSLKRTIFVDASPKLEVAWTSERGLIRDTDGEHVLVVSEDASTIVLEALQGSSKVIYEGEKGSVKKARLAAGGVVFATEVGDVREVVFGDGSETTAYANTNDFEVHGKMLAVRRVKAKKPLLEDIVLIDLELKSELFHTAPETAPEQDVSPPLYSVAENGDFVWLGDDGHLNRWGVGVSNPGGVTPMDPVGLVTDGENIGLLSLKGNKLELITDNGAELLCEGS